MDFLPLDSPGLGLFDVLIFVHVNDGNVSTMLGAYRPNDEVGRAEIEAKFLKAEFTPFHEVTRIRRLYTVPAQREIN